MQNGFSDPPLFCFLNERTPFFGTSKTRKKLFTVIVKIVFYQYLISKFMKLNCLPSSTILEIITLNFTDCCYIGMLPSGIAHKLVGYDYAAILYVLVVHLGCDYRSKCSFILVLSCIGTKVL